MALLGDIRKKSWLLILGIGLPLLAFLIGDAFSQGSIFGNPNELGTVGGAPVNVQDYNLAYNRLSSNPQAQSLSQNQLSEMAWNQVVSEKLVTQQMEDLGLDNVSETQYFEEAGRFFRSVNPELMDANGRVNVEMTKNFLSELKTMAQSGNAQAQNFYNQWLKVESQIQPRILSNAYTNLVSAGVLATNVDAAFAAKGNGMNEIEYVAVKYDDYVKTDSIAVTDAEIEAYMKGHPKTYKPEATVNLAYAYFPGEASAEDTSNIVSELNSFLAPQILKDKSLGTVDSIRAFANAVNDSAYVVRFSESQFDPTYYTREQFDSFPEDLKTKLKGSNQGDVVGPIKVGNVYNLIKVSDVKQITDSAKTSHILIGYAGSQARGEGITRTPEEAKALADSILAEIKINPAKFNEIASSDLSDDKVAAKDAGSIGWVGRFQQGFAESYRDWAVSNPKGSIDVVPSQFGFHIIRIDGVKQKTGYQLATIQKQIKPSDKTQEDLFNKANNLALTAQGKSANDFVNEARKEGGQVNNADGVSRFETNLTGLTGTQKESDILAWAFNEDTKPGSVKTFETRVGGQVIAYLSNKFSKDQLNITSARAEVEKIIRNQKIAKKIAEANPTVADLNAVATKYGTKVESGKVNFSRPMLSGLGVEPSLGGAVMGLADGKISGAIEGKNAVFFVKSIKKADVAAKEDYTNEMKSFETQNGAQIKNRVVNSLLEAADIDDNRAKLLK